MSCCPVVNFKQVHIFMKWFKNIIFSDHIVLEANFFWLWYTCQTAWGPSATAEQTDIKPADCVVQVVFEPAYKSINAYQVLLISGSKNLKSLSIVNFNMTLKYTCSGRPLGHEQIFPSISIEWGLGT